MSTIIIKDEIIERMCVVCNTVIPTQIQVGYFVDDITPERKRKWGIYVHYICTVCTETTSSHRTISEELNIYIEEEYIKGYSPKEEGKNNGEEV